MLRGLVCLERGCVAKDLAREQTLRGRGGVAARAVRLVGLEWGDAVAVVDSLDLDLRRTVPVDQAAT